MLRWSSVYNRYIFYERTGKIMKLRKQNKPMRARGALAGAVPVGSVELRADQLQSAAGGYSVKCKDEASSWNWAGAYVLRGFDKAGQPVRQVFKSEDAAHEWARTHNIC